MRGRGGCLSVFLALVGLALVGCSDKLRPQEDPGSVRMRRILQAYQLAADTRGRPPRNAQELGRFFKELGETGDPEQLLRSPRDGQPYVILFGPDFDFEARGTILAYEKTGTEGGRYVLTLAREVKLMKDEEFAQATFAKDHKPTPAK
jgi:hypothetical protein